MKKLLPFLFLLILSQIASAQLNRDSVLSSLPSDDTIKIRTSFNLMNITSIDEKEETIGFDGALIMRWKDERLAYEIDSTVFDDPEDAFRRTPLLNYQGDFAVKELYEGWRPQMLIANGIGNRNTTNMSIKIFPNGIVQYQETFSCVAETPLSLHLFPFDTQVLDIYVYPYPYSRQEVLLIPDSGLQWDWNINLGIDEWRRKKVVVSESALEIETHDGSRADASQLKVSVIVERKPLHTLLSAIFPMVVLVCLTWVVFWMDKSNVTERINISFIGILSVVAYYLVIQDDIPEINYLTLIDVFFILTFFILAASVMESIVVEKYNQRGMEATGDKVDKISRWAFPLLFFAGSIVVAIIFFAIHK